MKKVNMKYVGLLGIPLALLGVVTSVAMAAPATTPSAPVAQAVAAPSAQVSDTDTETNDDAAVSSTAKDTEAPGTPETNDDSSGPQEAPGTEVVD